MNTPIYYTNATNVRLKDFKEHEIAKENYKEHQLENRQKSIDYINYQVRLINLELTVLDFMLYQTIQELMIPIKAEMERVGIYRHQAKNLYNKAKHEIDSLCVACRISENYEMMSVLTNIYDIYRNDYMKEGGIFFDKICYMFSQLIKDDMVKFHYSIRMAIINAPGVKAQYANIATELYKVHLFCMMAEEVLLFEQDIIKTKFGVSIKLKQAQDSRFTAFESYVGKLYDMVGPKISKCSERLTYNVIMSGQIILNKLICSGTTDLLVDTMVESVYDYAYYCVARMLIDVRKQTGALSAKDIELLKSEIPMSDVQISQFTKELKRTRIDLSGDIMDIKDLIPRMKKAHVVNGVFINRVAGVLKQELIKNKK